MGCEVHEEVLSTKHAEHEKDRQLQLKYLFLPTLWGPYKYLSLVYSCDLRATEIQKLD